MRAGRKNMRARYLVGCDGGRSTTRRLMGVSFDGTTSPTRWLVVDVANDPLGHPNSEVGADPQRPYASISIAHGIRRFEFMIHADETDEQAEDPAFLARMLSYFVPHPDRVDVIRHRVYTHHSRIAGAFRRGRLLLAGDAAHLMPVWQGQGYNSGIRDAANLGWKLAAVVTGYAEDALLDTYDVERRKHARAMIDLSTMVGRVISPTNRRVAAARDLLVRSASIVPSLKRYVLEMRFKPMPRYEQGAVVHSEPRRSDSPVGTLFVQPRVDTREQQNVLLDDVLGGGFAVLCWNNNPREILRATAFANWKALGAKFVAAQAAESAALDRARRSRRSGRRRPRRRTQSLVRHPPRVRAVSAPRSLHRGRLHRSTRTRAERLALRRPHLDTGRENRAA